MSRGSSSLGGGGFGGGSSFGGGGHYGGGHSSNNGLLTGLILGSIFSRRGGSGPDGSVGNNENQNQVKYKKIRNNKATNIVAGIFLAIVATFIILAVVFRFDNVYSQINATATDYDESVEYGVKYYYTTYDFDIGSKHYSVQSKVGWTKLENMAGKAYTEENIQTYYLNKSYRIYYKNSNPYEVYEIEAKEDMDSPNAIYVFMAVVFGIITVAIYVGGINKYVVDEEYIQAVEKVAEAKDEHKKHKCPYCGSVIPDGETKCSNCGANLK